MFLAAAQQGGIKPMNVTYSNFKEANKLDETRAKSTNCLSCNMLNIPSFNEFINLKGRYGMQKKRIQMKRNQTYFNVKITLNINC